VPPRFAYWTIIAGGLPTAFRAVSRDELIPTFHRLREKHPDAVLKWFARGRLWESPEQARAEQEQRRAAGKGRAFGRPRSNEARGRDWRPGGDHRDPRQKYIDAKKARNTASRKQRFDRKQGTFAGGAGSKPPSPFERDRDRRPPREKPDRRDSRRPGKTSARPDPHKGHRGPGGGRTFDRPSFFRKTEQDDRKRRSHERPTEPEPTTPPDRPDRPPRARDDRRRRFPKP
jgi:hypothetical protein